MAAPPLAMRHVPKSSFGNTGLSVDIVSLTPAELA